MRATVATRTSTYAIWTGLLATSARPVCPRLARDITASVIPPNAPPVHAWIPALAGSQPMEAAPTRANPKGTKAKAIWRTSTRGSLQVRSPAHRARRAACIRPTAIKKVPVAVDPGARHQAINAAPASRTDTRSKRPNEAGRRPGISRASQFSRRASQSRSAWWTSRD